MVMRRNKQQHPLAVSGVVGDVLDPFVAALDPRVLYADGIPVSNGFSMRPSQVVTRPRVDIGGDDFRTFYTLVSLVVSTINYFVKFWSFMNLEF